jgi:hypothetical protein
MQSTLNGQATRQHRTRARCPAGNIRAQWESTMSFCENRATSVMLIAVGVLLAACHHHNDNQAPKAAITVSQPSADQVTTYAFSSAGSKDSDGRIATQRWDFGDGASSTAASPAHVYSASGSYVVKLTVTDDDGASASVTQALEITTPAVSVSSKNTAFSITLPHVATVEVPAASFATMTQIGLWTTANAITAADFDLTSQMFKAPMRAAREMRVNTGQVQPTNTLTVIANIPAELEAHLQANDEPRVFVQVLQGGGDEVLDSFELVDALYDATSKTLRFNLEPGMFTNRRSADETWEAVIVVGSTRTKPTSSTSGAPRPSALGKSVEAEQLRPWPALAIAGGFNSTDFGSDLLPSATASTCDGATLQAPLASVTVTGAFNPPQTLWCRLSSCRWYRGSFDGKRQSLADRI